MSKWDSRFMDLARLVASWSKDPSTQVGAVIVDQDKRIVSTGFNGFPRCVNDAPVDREVKLLRTIHAEENALLFARQDIIWHKPNPMPESVTDRCTKAHEYLFLLSKSERYYFDHDAMKEDAINAGKRVFLGEKSFSKGQSKAAGISPSGNAKFEFYDVPATRNRRSVWTVTPKPYKGAHFAVYPPELIEPCVLAGCPEGGTVLDPFGGSGTTGGVALKHGRNAVLCELSPDYAALMPARIESITC